MEKKFLVKVAGQEILMNKIFKSRIFYVVKITITLTILYFIFHKIDFKQLGKAILAVDSKTLLLLLITTAFKLFIEVYNWSRYLKVNPDYKLTWKEIFRSHMIGHSLRFLIPGGHAVVGKMYFVNNSKKLSFLSVGMEKFFQIWINLVFAAFASIFYFRKQTILLTTIVFFIILFLPFLLYYTRHLNRKKNWEKYFLSYRKIIPRIAILQSCYMAITIFQYFLLLNVFKAFHIFSAIISIPLILFANIIPITYAGLGLREKFAMEILAKYDISVEIAVATSLVIFILNSVLPAIIGVICLLKNRK